MNDTVPCPFRIAGKICPQGNGWHRALSRGYKSCLYSYIGLQHDLLGTPGSYDDMTAQVAKRYGDIELDHSTYETPLTPPAALALLPRAVKADLPKIGKITDASHMGYASIWLAHLFHGDSIMTDMNETMASHGRYYLHVLANFGTTPQYGVSGPGLEYAIDPTAKIYTTISSGGRFHTEGGIMLSCRQEGRPEVTFQMPGIGVDRSHYAKTTEDWCENMGKWVSEAIQVGYLPANLGYKFHDRDGYFFTEINGYWSDHHRLITRDIDERTRHHFQHSPASLEIEDRIVSMMDSYRGAGQARSSIKLAIGNNI